MAAIFDTHAHYTAAAFDADREAVLSALPGKNVALVVDCGTDLESSLASLALGERYPFLHTAAGIHPESLIEEDASTPVSYTHLDVYKRQALCRARPGRK